MFVETPELRGLVICGCCYAALTEAGGDGGATMGATAGVSRSVDGSPVGFPLSRVGLEGGLRLGCKVRDRAGGHQVYGTAAVPDDWAARVHYSSAYRALLVDYCHSNSGRPHCSNGMQNHSPSPSGI